MLGMSMARSFSGTLTIGLIVYRREGSAQRGRGVIYDCLVWICYTFYLSVFFYSSPNLSGHRLDVYHTSTHGVALVLTDIIGSDRLKFS